MSAKAGWIVLWRHDKGTEYDPLYWDERDGTLYNGIHRGTLFPTYESARNAVRRARRWWERKWPRQTRPRHTASSARGSHD